MDVFSFRSAACAVARLLICVAAAGCARGQQASSAPAYDDDQTPAIRGAQPSYPGLPHAAKVETDAGPLKVRFYGTILMNTSISDSGVFGQDLPLWALPDATPVTFPDGTTGRAGNNHDLIFTMRQSILGVALSPAKPVSGWNPSALVEMDFFGSRPADTSQPLNRVLDQPRLRLGYLQLEHGPVKIVAGQDKMILAPLDPVSLSHVAAPLGATAGDLWGWFPQVRVEVEKTIGSTGILFQAGILRPQFGDPRLENPPAAGTAIDTTTSGLGERTSQPFYQARVAISPKIGGRTSTFGFAGHFGTEKVGVDRTMQSWAFAFDMNVRLERHLILRGEAYAGSNLIPFQGGIDQGVALVAGNPLKIQRVGDAGGWGELTYLPKPGGGKNAFYVGAGTDDPVNGNLLAGSTRSKNSFLWASYFRRITSDVTLALEWSYWDFQTISIVGGVPGGRAGTGTANVVSASIAYQF